MRERHAVLLWSRHAPILAGERTAMKRKAWQAAESHSIFIAQDPANPGTASGADPRGRCRSGKRGSRCASRSPRRGSGRDTSPSEGWCSDRLESLTQIAGELSVGNRHFLRDRFRLHEFHEVIVEQLQDHSSQVESDKNLGQPDSAACPPACTNLPKTDADLASIIAVWPTLAEPIRIAILALVGASTSTKECFIE